MVLSCPLVTTLVTCSLLQDFSGGGGAICIQQAEQAIEWQLSRFAAADPCQSLRSSDSRDGIILESQSIRFANLSIHFGRREVASSKKCQGIKCNKNFRIYRNYFIEIYCTSTSPPSRRLIPVHQIDSLSLPILHLPEELHIHRHK